ncbi:MAG: peptidoglycan-binding protein [Acidimicrobiales bacterium]|nr:peptidoglycan-binding protein [Acidimicrobiales bacterium]
MVALPLGPGSSGEAVADLQRRLGALGLAEEVQTDPIGLYSSGTDAAVRAFQARYGLDIDGVVSELTWSILVEVGYHLGDRQLYLRSPMMRGDDIADLQGRLGALGFDAGRADGIFGPLTAAALAEFQRNAGLSTDGICGPDTVDALHRLGPARTAAVMVNHVRERERRRMGSPSVAGRRIAIGHAGGLAALTQALHRNLRELGAVALVLHHPDGSAQARMANTFEADAFLALRLNAQPTNRMAYFRGVNFWSEAGLSLAERAGEAVQGLSGLAPEVIGVRLPLLRETRMPAVIAEIGPAGFVVTANEALARVLTGALASWVAEPSTGVPTASTSTTG